MAWTPWRGLHFASIKATTGLSLAKTHNESLPNPSKLESKAETLARLPCSVIHQKSFTGSPLGIENKDLPFLLGSNINLHKTGADHQSAVFFCTYMTRERTGTISSVSSKNVKNSLVLNSLLFLFFQTWTPPTDIQLQPRQDHHEQQTARRESQQSHHGSKNYWKFRNPMEGLFHIFDRDWSKENWNVSPFHFINLM